MRGSRKWLRALLRRAHSRARANDRSRLPALLATQPCRDVFRRDFPPYFSAQQAVLAGTGWDWRGTYRRRLQHDQNWKQGQLAMPAELLRSHTGWVPPPQRARGCDGCAAEDKECSCT